MLRLLLFLLFLIVLYLMISNDFVATKLKLRDRQSQLDAVNLDFESSGKDARNLTTATASNLTRPADAAQKTCCNSFYELSSQYSLPKLNKICDIVPIEIKCMRKCLEISEEKRKEFNLEVSDRIEEWIEHRLSFHEVICEKIQQELKLHAKQAILTQFVPIEESTKSDDDSQRISKEEAFSLIKSISSNLGLNQLDSFEHEFLSNDPKANRFNVNRRGIEILKQVRMVSKLLNEENKQRLRSAKERRPKSNSKLTEQQLIHLDRQNKLIKANHPASFRPAQTNQPTGSPQHQHALPQFGSPFRPGQPPSHYSPPVNQPVNQPINQKPSNHLSSQFLRPPPPPPPGWRREVKDAYEDEIDPPKRQIREAAKPPTEQLDETTTTVLPDLIDDTQTEVADAPQTASSLIEEQHQSSPNPSKIEEEQQSSPNSSTIEEQHQASSDPPRIEELTTRSVPVDDVLTESPSNQLERREEKELEAVDSDDLISSDAASPPSVEVHDQSASLPNIEPDIEQPISLPDSEPDSEQPVSLPDSEPDNEQPVSMANIEADHYQPSSPPNIEAVYDEMTTTEMPPDVTEGYRCVQVKLNQSVIDHLKKLYPGIEFRPVKDQPNGSNEEPAEEAEPKEDAITTAAPNTISTTAPITDPKTDGSNQVNVRGILSSIFGSGQKEVSEKPNPNPEQEEVVFGHMSSKLIEQLSKSSSHEKINQLASEVLHNQSMPCQQEFLPNLSDLLSKNLMLKHSTGVFRQERTAEADKLCNQMLEIGGKLNGQIQNCAQSVEVEYMIKFTFNETEQGFKYCLRIDFKEKLTNANDRIDQSESVLVGHLEMNETEMNQLEANQISQISRLSEVNLTEANVSNVSKTNVSQATDQMVDCLDWAKLKSCQTKFIPWLQLIEVVELKRLVDNKSTPFNELHLFKQNISAIASSGQVSAANCKDLVLFENCAKQDLDGAINVDHRSGRLLINHNTTCEVGTLRLNKLRLVTSLTNKITSQINEHMSPHCPKLSTILGLAGNSSQSETDAYRQNLMSHYIKRYIDIVDDPECTDTTQVFMEFCVKKFTRHLKPSYVQFYKNLELQYHFGKTFVSNHRILPSVCCAQRQLAECFISGANFKCKKDERRSSELLQIGELAYCDEINAKMSMSKCRKVLAVKNPQKASSSVSMSLSSLSAFFVVATLLLSLSASRI